MSLVRLVAKRLLIMPFSLFVLVTFAFGIVELMPGDPALLILGAFATPESVARVHGQLHLDEPFLTRYASYVEDLVHGDLGSSFLTGASVTDDIQRYLPNTVELVALSLVFAGLVGFVVGTFGAYFQNRLPDTVSRALISSCQSIPDFLLALLLIYFLFFLAGVAPSPIGRLGLGETRPPSSTGFLLVDSILARDWGILWSALEHLFLPVVALGTVYSAYFAKTTRATMGKAMNSPQVEFARACGLPERQVLRYALLDARTPILTYAAILFGTLIGGAAIVETVFAWQGVGQWALEAILAKDIPIVQGFILLSGVATLVIYLLLDVLVLVLDPRVSYG
jgi:peptide/nickel transport system permease protein